MAGDKFLARIESAAKFLATPVAQQARGYLDPPLERALEVLAIFADGKPHNYQEISEATGLHPNTASGIIRALERGGYPLQFTYAEVKDSSPGRPAVLVKKGKIKR
jgi:DNA-binding transcriptional ArsR family regulator